MEVEYRISKETQKHMLIVAGVFDLVSLVPIVNIISKLFAAMLFWLWFAFYSIHFTKNPKMFSNLLITLILGFIPIVSMLPEQMWNIYRITNLARLEDEQYNK